MPARVEGYISVDVSDYSDELEIFADADDIAELMEFNNIDIQEMIDHFDHNQDVDMSAVENYITDVCDHDDLVVIINMCLTRFKSDYSSTFSQMVENRDQADQAKAELKVLTGGANVSEIRSSC